MLQGACLKSKLLVIKVCALHTPLALKTNSYNNTHSFFRFKFLVYLIYNNHYFVPININDVIKWIKGLL